MDTVTVIPLFTQRSNKLAPVRQGDPSGALNALVPALECEGPVPTLADPNMTG
jgi:hypothetical protein